MRGVYVAKHKLYNNTFKIGFSNDIKKRLMSLSTPFKVADKLKLHSWFYVISENDTNNLQELETQIHNELSQYRHENTELFCFDDKNVYVVLRNVYQVLKTKYSDLLRWSFIDGSSEEIDKLENEIISCVITSLKEHKKYTVHIPANCVRQRILKKIVSDVFNKGEYKICISPNIKFDDTNTAIYEEKYNSENFDLIIYEENDLLMKKITCDMELILTQKPIIKYITPFIIPYNLLNYADNNSINRYTFTNRITIVNINQPIKPNTFEAKVNLCLEFENGGKNYIINSTSHKNVRIGAFLARQKIGRAHV